MFTRLTSAALASALIATLASCNNAPPPKPPTAPTPAPNKPQPAPESKTSAPTPPVAPNKPAGALKTSTEADDPNTLQAGGIVAPKPAIWTWQAPTAQFRTLQYSVPGKGSSTESAELIVSVFGGAGGGGPVDGNITRWVNQFSTADGGNVQPTRTDKTIDGMPVALVELKGTYTGMGAGGPKPDQMQFGAIITAPDSGVFIRLIGPAATVEAERENWNKLIDGIKKQ